MALQQGNMSPFHDPCITIPDSSSGTVSLPVAKKPGKANKKKKKGQGQGRAAGAGRHSFL
jgi:hypothetical protein